MFRRVLHPAGKCSKGHQPQALHHPESRLHLKPVLAIRDFTEHYAWSAQGQKRFQCTTDFHSALRSRPAGLPKRLRSSVPPNPGARKISVTWHSARRDNLLSKSVQILSVLFSWTDHRAECVRIRATSSSSTSWTSGYQHPTSAS